MTDKIINTILQNTYIEDDLTSRLGFLRTFLSEHLFGEKRGSSLREVLQDDCPDEIIQSLDEWLHSFREKTISLHQVYETLDALENRINTMPTVTLYVPIKFSSQYIVSFGKWFRENVQSDLLIALRIDLRMSGGCGFVWKDVYYDFSLRYFVQKRQTEIITMFNKYSYDK